MKKAPPLRLSLRKLTLAMFAVGPMAILPSPLLAVVPQGTTAPFNTTSGSATWNGAGTTGTINASNRAVLEWGVTTGTVASPVTIDGVTINDGTSLTNFNIAAGQTYNFVVPSGGAVLNRVSAGTNATHANLGGLGAAAAIINGTLLSNGAVFVLANGNIIVGTGAQISTASGLTLSTLNDGNFDFIATGNLPLTGASQGNIFLGGGTGAATFVGNLTAAAGAITTNNVSVSGDLILNKTGTGGLALTTTSPTSVGGNFTATTNNGAITQGTGALSVANGATTLKTGTGSITLDVATNDFSSVTVNTSGTSDVALRDANVITLGASTIGQDLTVTATGVGNGTVSIGTNGTLTIGRNANFTTTGARAPINIGNNTTVAGVLTMAAGSNSSATFNGLGNITIGNGSLAGITAGTGNQSSVSITTNGVLTIGNTITATGNSNGGGGAITLTAGSITQNAASNVTTSAGGGAITLNATAGNITLNGNLVNSSGSAGTAIRLTTAGGAITQAATGAALVTANTTGTTVVNVGTGTANLTAANQLANGSILQVTAGNATFNGTGTAGSFQLGTANVTGNLTLNNDSGANSIVLGAGLGTNGQNVTVGGVLAATVAGTGTITDGDYSAFNVAGGLNLTTAGGVVTLDGAVVNGSLAPSVQFGQVRIAAPGAAVTIAERTTLNLANITAASLNATSTAGSIINTGDLTIAGTADFRTTGAATSVITNATNSIGTVNFIGSGGALTVGAGGVTLGATTNVTSGDDIILTSTNGGTITLGPVSIGGSLTVNSSGGITTLAGAGALLTQQSNTTVGGNLSLTSATAITQAANSRFVVTGVTEVASAGAATLTNANDFVGGVVLNQAASTGAVAINDLNDLRISGVAGGAVTAMAGAGGDLSIDAPWNMVLGNLNVASLEARAVNGGAGSSGTVTQASGTSIHSEGLLRVVSNGGNIVLGNNGNSAGRVEFWTNGAATITTGGNGTASVTYTEDGTIRVGNLATNSNSTLTSRFGSIIEDNNADTFFNVRATLIANASAGSILIGGTTNGTTATTGGNVAAFSASAPTGAVAVRGNDSITLRDINANSLIVTATNNISQSAPIRVFGTASFNTTNTGASRNITLTNNANSFGPLSFTVGNNTSNIAVTESGTLNLRTVSMVGGGNSTFTATSLNGDIIDSGIQGVRLGGNSTTSGSGVVTLTATNGNIVIDDPLSEFATSSGVLFNAKNVNLEITGTNTSNLVLGAATGPSQATGNLTVRTALGNISNAGVFTAAGDASFQAPAGSIVISQPGVGFGRLRFVGNQVSISESGSMNIMTGSSSTGPANLVSGGSITIENVGGGIVTFGNTVNLTATGDITLPKLIQAGGLLTVRHTGTANLSALSISGDLGNITPVDGGTGPYVAPAP